MGGQGSGRKPNPNNIVNRFNSIVPNSSPINNICLPNLSGVKKEALKTSSVDITVGEETISSNGGLIYIDHGATAGTSRPDVSGYVMWIGSVEPTNATNGDVWIDTS